MSTDGRIVLADKLAVLAATADDSIDLIHAAPPLNTGQARVLEGALISRGPLGLALARCRRVYRWNT